MENVVANFTLGDQPELQADFSISEQEPLIAEFEVDVFEKRHNKLINRELPDQHPISAITGLEDALNSIDAGIGDFAQEVNDSITSVINALKLEEDNRKLADEQLESSINTEAQARISADANIINTLQPQINRETAERIASDNELRELIESETAQREANDTSINARISREEVARMEGDDSLRADLNAEISRSTSRDEFLQVQIDQLGQGVSEALEIEKNARIDADNDLSDRIDDNLADIEHIESLIPAQASSSNKLADKEFVNSSIATNTAEFIGTFNSVAELEAYSGKLDNNDYAFVVEIDQHGNTVYNRYKYNGSEWLFEYALNNSSFTSEQWSAINSGITAVLTEQITTNQSNIATEVQRATQAEQVLTNTKQNKLTAGIGISIENDVISSTYDDTDILIDISDLQSDVQDINRILPTKADTVAVSGALALKQDVLTAGRGIEITSSNVINNTLTSAEWGNITGDIADQTDLQQELAKAGTPDDITIVKTQENKLQAIGTIEKNKNLPKYDWIGTLAEYEAQDVATQHPTWLCFITDDFVSGGGGTPANAVTKDGNNVMTGTINIENDSNHPMIITGLAGASASGYQIIDSNGAGDSDFEHLATGDRYITRIANHNNTSDTTAYIDLYQSNVGKSVLDLSNIQSILAPALLGVMYPVGAIYITTNATCPIEDLGVGTWELVSQDRVLQGAGTRGVVGTTLGESLPQHTHTRGTMNITGHIGTTSSYGTTYASGAFYNASGTNIDSAGAGNKNKPRIDFDASKSWTGATSNASGSTYQDNAPVQQDAYLVNIFRRIQ